MSEKVTIKVERKKLHLPTIALRGLVVFPNNLVHFEVGREKSIAAVEWAMANNSNVFLVAQKSMDTTEPQQADLFSYGVVAEVKQVLRVSGDLVKVLVEGKYRAKLSALDASGDFLLSEVRPAPVRAGKADDAVETAQNAAKALDVTLHVIEAADTAADELLKFQLLMQTADKLDCRFISTGHYARVEQDADECRLCAPEHAECDQTALLEVLPQEILARLILPLGEFDKESVQEIAQDIGCAE